MSFSWCPEPLKKCVINFRVRPRFGNFQIFFSFLLYTPPLVLINDLYLYVGLIYFNIKCGIFHFRRSTKYVQSGTEPNLMQKFLWAILYYQVLHLPDYCQLQKYYMIQPRSSIPSLLHVKWHYSNAAISTPSGFK